MSLRLNCDLGESVNGDLHIESAVMPYLDQANIACGFHAGNALTMQGTLQLAKEHGVIVGAHPSYDDRENFGRRSILCNHDDIVSLIHQQINHLENIAQSIAMTVDYVKPHGALYNDMMDNTGIRAAIMEAVASYSQSIVLMLQATPASAEHRKEAESHGINIWFEAFADRCYDDSGLLLPRHHPTAVHNADKTLQQVELLCNRRCVISANGIELPITADSLCIHGDNEHAVKHIGTIRQLMNGAG